jgi:auxin response factor
LEFEVLGCCIGAHKMGSVEEKIRAGGLISGANTSLVEGMKFLKEMQDQSGLFPFIKKSFFFS